MLRFDVHYSPTSYHLTAGHVAADGVIVSTPTGSTAYFFIGRGGRLFAPQLAPWCSTPISAHIPSLTATGDRGNALWFEIKFTALPREVMLTADGQGKFINCPDDKVKIFTAPHKTRY